MGVLDGIKVVELAEHGCPSWCGSWPTGARDSSVRPGVIAQAFVADTGDFNFLFELYDRNKRGIALDLRVGAPPSTG